MSTTFNNNDLVIAFFNYSPNHPACIVGIAVFALLSILLSIRIFRSKSPLYLLLLPFIALVETAGFVLRYVCSLHPAIDVFTAMTILTLVAGNIIVLVNYKTVGDLILFSNVKTRYFVIGPNFTRIFWQSNIVVTILQSVGGSLLSSGGSESIGYILLIVGTSAQLLLFATLLLCIHYVRIHPDYQYNTNEATDKSKLMKVILITTMLIFARSTYRLVNYLATHNHPARIKEWEFYIFDALLVALCFLIHFIWFIGNYIPPRDTQQDYVQSRGSEDSICQI